MQNESISIERVGHIKPDRRLRVTLVKLHKNRQIGAEIDGCAFSGGQFRQFEAHLLLHLEYLTTKRA